MERPMVVYNLQLKFQIFDWLRRGRLIADPLSKYHLHCRNLCRTTARELWPMFVTGELENQTEWAERLRKK